LEINFGVS